MILESQVISLDLAHKLKELGVKQDSQFYYVKATSIGGYYFEKEVCMIAHISQTTGLSKDWSSAFTVAELSDMLPYEIHDQNLILTKVWSAWEIKYQEGDYPHEKSLARIVDDNLSNCLAKTLIYLIENNYVQVEDL